MKTPTPAAEASTAAREAPIDAMKALASIIEAYDAYRRRGVMPAPVEYADVVRAIDAARAALATTSAPVARVDSWVNGSYHRKYTLTWLEDVPEGALLYTAPPAAQPVAPAGWKLVPLEPTNAMTFVGQQLRRDPTNSISHVYGAMLAAAPSASEAPRQEDAA